MGSSVALLLEALFIGAKDSLSGRERTCFSDFCSGAVWAAKGMPDNLELRLLARETMNPTAVIFDNDGEILIVDGLGGKVYLLIFPNDTKGWRSFAEIAHPMLISERRINNALFTVRQGYENSRRWRWAQPIWDFYQWLRSPFNRPTN